MEDGNIANKVVIDDHITVIDGDNTTTITGDTVSTTTLSGTLDAESMKNSLTAEAIQAVAPIAWVENTATPLKARGSIAFGSGTKTMRNNVAIGVDAEVQDLANAIGYGSFAESAGQSFGNVARTGNRGVAVGHYAKSGGGSISIGAQAESDTCSVALGDCAKARKNTSITIGSQFTEATDSGNVTHTCTTEGTGSITIGAGANTLNTTASDGTVTESSNSVTIGCKASNSGADSIVIGAQASNSVAGNIVIGAGASASAPNSVVLGATARGSGNGDIAIGAGASSNGGTSIGIAANTKSNYDIAIGRNSNAGGTGGSCAIGSSARAIYDGIAIGIRSEAKSRGGIAVGFSARANKNFSTAIGLNAISNDVSAVVFSSWDETLTILTQLYFSGANTPLAKKYFPTAWEQKQDVDEQGNPKVDESGNPVMVDDKTKPIAGEAMMGFVARDKDGNIIARGANMLSALFPYYNGDNENPFTPTTMSLDGESQEPIAFHPSDLDLPIEEPSDINDVEINISTIEAPIEEEYKPLPVYPIVEPTIDEITE